MARLPTVGGDAGNWGEILNDYLSQSHTVDGLLKTDSVGAPQLKPSAVTSAALAPGAVTSAKIDKLGQAGGVATLDGNGKLPEGNLPDRLSTTALGAAYVTKPAGITDGQVPVWNAAQTTFVAGASGNAGAGVTFVTLTSASQAVTIPTGSVAGLALVQDATGGRTATWPTGIRWDGGTTPTLSSAAGATDVFTFIAVTGGGWLGKKDGSHPAPADTTTPSAVTNLVAGTATTTSVPLTWTAATDNVAVTGYEYSTNGTTWTSTGSTSTSYTVTGLTANTSYTIQVRAFDAAGNKGTAASVTATTAAVAGPAPGTVLTSDSFTGADVASINGRATDIALGGSAMTWAGSGTLGISANALAQTSASPTGGSGSLAFTATENIQLDFNLATMPSASIDIYLKAGATIAAIIRLSNVGHEVMTAGFGGTGWAVTGGPGLVRLIIKGTAMSGYLPNNQGGTTNGTATNNAVYQYDSIQWSTGTVTGFAIDDVKVSIPA